MCLPKEECHSMDDFKWQGIEQSLPLALGWVAWRIPFPSSIYLACLLQLHNLRMVYNLWKWLVGVLEWWSSNLERPHGLKLRPWGLLNDSTGSIHFIKKEAKPTEALCHDSQTQCLFSGMHAALNFFGIVLICSPCLQWLGFKEPLVPQNPAQGRCSVSVAEGELRSSPVAAEPLCDLVQVPGTSKS